MKVPSGVGRVIKTLNIADSTTTSEAIEIPSGMRLAAIQFPAGLGASSLSFTGSTDGSTYVAVEDPDGTLVTVTVGASLYVLMPELSSIPFLKLVLGTTQSPAIDLALVFESFGPSPYWHSGAILPGA